MNNHGGESRFANRLLYSPQSRIECDEHIFAAAGATAFSGTMTVVALEVVACVVGASQTVTVECSPRRSKVAGWAIYAVANSNTCLMAKSTIPISTFARLAADVRASLTNQTAGVRMS